MGGQLGKEKAGRTQRTVVPVILGRSVREAASNDGPPPEDLADDCAAEDQVGLVRKRRESSAADDLVELGVGAGLDLGVRDHRHHEGRDAVGGRVRSGAVHLRGAETVELRVRGNRQRTRRTAPAKNVASSSLSWYAFCDSRMYLVKQ